MRPVVPPGQLPLQDLARRVAWELVEEHDLARHLEPGEVLLHPVLEVVLGDVTGDHHEGLEPLAEVGVVDAQRRHLDHALVPGQTVLDLLGEDVLSAGDDHLVVATLDEQVAVLVEAADVAAAHQPVEIGRAHV